MYPNAGTCTVHARHATCICIHISMRVCVNVCASEYVSMYVCVAKWNKMGVSDHMVERVRKMERFIKHFIVRCNKLLEK